MAEQRARAAAAVAAALLVLAGCAGGREATEVVPSGGVVPSFAITIPDQRDGVYEPGPATARRDREACAAAPASIVPTFCLDAPAGSLGPAGSRPSLDALAQATGRAFREVKTSRGDLVLETTIVAADGARLAEALERGTEALEREFGRAFAPRPISYVFGSRSSFSAALALAFRYPASESARLAGSSGGAYLTLPGAIVVNWENVFRQGPITILRHELSHALVDQLSAGAPVPLWLDEGLATHQERSITGAVERDRYVARSLVATGRLGLNDLAIAATWLSRDPAEAAYGYLVAAEGVRLLREGVPMPQLVLVLEEAAKLRSFVTGFESVTGRSLAAFVSAFPAALAREAVPGIAADAGIWTLHDFPPGAAVAVTIARAPTYLVAFEVRADEFGTYAAAFGSTVSAGRYVITATAGSVVATTRVDVP